MEFLKKHTDLIYKVLLGFIFASALIFRVRGYFFNYSFWFDESALALNIVNHSFIDYFKPLENTQVAPPLFMILSKIMVNIFGNHEWVYRFFPLVFGLISIPVFYVFSKEFLSKKISLLIVNFLFAVNYPLILYCFEFKPYSLDLLLFMLGFLLLKRIDYANKKHLILTAVSFAILPYITLPALFLIAAFDICSLIYKKINFKKLILVNLPVFFSMLVYLFIILIPQRAVMLDEYALYWGKRLLSFSHNAIYPVYETLNWAFLPNPFLLIILLVFIVGSIFAILDKKPAIIFMVVVFLLGIVSSLTKLYPFCVRMILFFLPVILIMFVYPLEKIQMKKYWIWLLVLLLCFFKYDFSYVTKLLTDFGANKFCEKTIYFDTNDFMKSIMESYKDGDFILVSSRSRYDFFYYRDKLNFDTKAYAILRTSELTKEQFFQAMDLIFNSIKGDLFFFVITDYTVHPDLKYLDDWIESRHLAIEVNRYKNHTAFMIKVKR